MLPYLRDALVKNLWGIINRGYTVSSHTQPNDDDSCSFIRNGNTIHANNNRNTNTLNIFQSLRKWLKFCDWQKTVVSVMCQSNNMLTFSIQYSEARQSLLLTKIHVIYGKLSVYSTYSFFGKEERTGYKNFAGR